MGNRAGWNLELTRLTSARLGHSAIAPCRHRLVSFTGKATLIVDSPEECWGRKPSADDQTEGLPRANDCSDGPWSAAAFPSHAVCLSIIGFVSPTKGNRGSCTQTWSREWTSGAG